MNVELSHEVHEGEGPLLVLIHGMLSSRAQWTPNLPGLSKFSRLVVVELFGHGRAPSPDDPAAYHPDAYVAALERLRVSLGAKRWALCGQSFGATVTLRYALRHPDRVIAHIFTNSTSALADPEWVARANAGVAANADTIEREGRAGLEKMPFHPRNAKRLPAQVHAALLHDAELLNPLGIARTLRLSVPSSSLHGEIARNRVPTLLVCGEREKRFQPFRDYAQREMPQLDVVALDAAHAVNIEEAPAFEEAVASFLKKHGADSP